jgi:hypothetical protein
MLMNITVLVDTIVTGSQHAQNSSIPITSNQGNFNFSKIVHHSLTMKVLLHYEDNEDTELWKSLKITLPKSWKNGPTSKLLSQFVQSYNSNDAFANNKLTEDNMHLALRYQAEDKSQLKPLASDAVILDCIPDRADVYVMHGASRTLEDILQEEKAKAEQMQTELRNTVQCTHFGCKNRFPKGGPYPACRYHKAPPVFHETAKWWSCCPHKKAYDWDEFQNIPGCETGTCTDVKENEKLFLGGTDLRGQASDTAKLKSIDDFNKAQAAGSEAAPVLERLQKVMEEVGVEKELFEQVIEGIKKKHSSASIANEAELLETTKSEIGLIMNAAFKAAAAEQLRLN